MKINIIEETNDFIAIIKPANIPVQGTRQQNVSVLSYLEDFFEFKCGIENPFIGLVHRLDQPTGGLMVFAKNNKSLSSLSKLFQNRGVSKRYLAVVDGTLADGGRLVHYLKADKQKNHVIASESPIDGYKKAALTYEIVQHLIIEGHEATLVEIVLETGRQHQIRAQFSALGHGLIGDHKYGLVLGHQPLMLWSYQLDFKLGKNTYHLEAPISESPMAPFI